MDIPIRYDERAALHSTSSRLHWMSVVRTIMRLRSGALPGDWQAKVEQSGLHARARLSWGAGGVSGTPGERCLWGMDVPCTDNRLCNPLRRRGPTWFFLCEDVLPGDLSPDWTHCFDPRRLDSWAKNLTGPTSIGLDPAVGCA